MFEQATNKEMIELDALIKAIFETMTDGIFVYNLEGKVVQVNVAAQKLLEMRAEDVIGKYYYQLADVFGICNELHQPLLPEQMSISHILQKEIQKQSQQRDLLLKLSGGREIIVNTTRSPLYNQQRQLIGCVAILRDITEHRQKENHTLQAFTALLTLVEALAGIPGQREQTAKAIIENTLPINAAGEALAEIISQVLNSQYVDVFMLEPPGDLQHLIGVTGLAPWQEQQLRAEVERAPLIDYISESAIAQLHANEVVLLDLQHTPYRTPRTNFGARYRLLAPMVLQEQLVGLFVIAKTDIGYADIACAYRQEEIALARGVAKLTALVIERVSLLQAWAEAHANELAMQESNRRYDTFVSIASHELRTPLTTVKGNLELAQRRLDKLIKQEGQECVNKLMGLRQPLVHAVQRANMQARMISELLDTSRIQTHTLTMVMSPCNLLEIVRSAVEDIQLTETERTILFHPASEEDIPLYADADRISQVVTNYVWNALKYSEMTQPVEVYVARERALARVTVRDRGSGFSAEHQERIWERFYQAPEAVVHYTAGTSGLGLGLYLSQTIIELHHGQVGVESVQGEGSTFWFTLPIKP